MILKNVHTEIKEVVYEGIISALLEPFGGWFLAKYHIMTKCYIYQLREDVFLLYCLFPYSFIMKQSRDQKFQD